MAVDAANARIFGSDDDRVMIAPLGTDLPEDLGDPDPAFTDLGWLGTDGIGFTPSDSVEKFRGHQGGRVVRTKNTESDTTFTFQCLETTAATLGLQYKITDQSTTDGTTTMTVSSGRDVIARSFVIDVYDSDAETIHYRYVIPRGEIGERSEFTLSNSDITAYEFTVEIIGDYFVITNDEAVAVTTP